MPLDLDMLGQERTKWHPLTGALQGVEMLIRYASPGEGERFRQQMIREGILRNTRDAGIDINVGRSKDYFREWAKKWVLDWRGDVKPEGTKYTPELLGQVLDQYRPAHTQLNVATLEEEGFFDSNGTQPDEI